MSILFLVLAISNPCIESQPVTTGQEIQCDGILFPGAWAEQSIKCVSVDLPSAEGRAEDNKNLLGLCEIAKGELTEEYDKTLLELEKISRDAAGLNAVPWYKNPWLWGTFGFISGGVTVFYLTK